MSVKGIHLAWIVVADINKAIKFYTESVGMILQTFEEKYGWAELSGNESGAILGIAQHSEDESILPGQNAVITLSVDNLEKAIADMTARGVNKKGETLEIPGHVKLQMMVDPDQNHFQLVQQLQ